MSTGGLEWFNIPFNSFGVDFPEDWWAGDGVVFVSFAAVVVDFMACSVSKNTFEKLMCLGNLATPSYRYK